MDLLNAIKPHRDFYVEYFRSEIQKMSDSQEGCAEVLYRKQTGNPESVYDYSRVDFVCSDDRTTNFSSNEFPDQEPVCLSVKGAEVNVYPVKWSWCEITAELSPGYLTFLEAWIEKWMKLDDPEPEKDLMEAIHYVGDPFEEMDYTMLIIDMGTAPAEALAELVELFVVKAGATRVDIGDIKNCRHLGKTDSWEKCKAKLAAKNLTTLQDLELLVKPLIRDATELILEEPSDSSHDSQLISHFGGEPYFEKGDHWPVTEEGKPLDFVFQVFNDTGLCLPEPVRLVQFFYDRDASPWESWEDGWSVKIFEELHPQRRIHIARPAELRKPVFCKIKYRTVKSLPDWEGINVIHRDAANLSLVLDRERPWRCYAQVVKNLAGEQKYRSQLGGYPKWVQGESTPGHPNTVKLLFQIDSEDRAGLMWGDVGLVYVFYEEQTRAVDFMLQCH